MLIINDIKEPITEPDLDYVEWQKYLETCEADGTTPSISDYVVWLGESREASRIQTLSQGGKK